MAVNNLNSGVGIQPTIVDAKGDLIAATANDAVNRLAVGTNGQVLVADSGETTGLKWNNPGTVGGLVHINTTTADAVASISLGSDANPIFSSTYDFYRVIFSSQVTGSDTNRTFTLRLRANVTDNSSTSYRVANLGYNSGGSNVNNNINPATSFLINTNAYYTGANKYNSIMDILNPFNASTTTSINGLSTGIDVGEAIVQMFGGNFTSAAGFNGFSIINSSGNFSNAVVQVYGYKA